MLLRVNLYKRKKSSYFSSISKNNSKLDSKTNSTICTPPQKHSVHEVVTKAVHEMILGIDFLIDADVDWSFSQGKIKLGDEWIQLH